MYGSLQEALREDLKSLRKEGLYKEERVIVSPQDAVIRLKNGVELLNFCANNYLGLSAHPRLIEAAEKSLRQRGYGLSSVRFICGTQDIHKALEEKISTFLGTEETILYAAAFDANGGVFEPLFDERDVIISDTLNHASLIDGMRLCKAKRTRYTHNDMESLEGQLKQFAKSRYQIIVTDGVFSMDGTVAQLDSICDLADKYGALVLSDECHATGVLGKTGRGTHEYRGVMGRVDIITGTLGKALGGASGGFVSAHKEIIDMLRQRSRPYLFSNALPPPIVGASLAALDLIGAGTSHLSRLEANTRYFRGKMVATGFDIVPGPHPIVPIMLHEASRAQRMAQELAAAGIYVVGFSYPVVPKGKARIRVQLSAAHEKQHLERAVEAFTRIGKALGVLVPPSN